MKSSCLTARCLACSLFAVAPCVQGAEGRIVFDGSIVEPGCPMRELTLDCPPGRRVDAVVRALDLATAQRRIQADLLAYASQRDPSVAWRVVDVTYR